MSDSVDQAKRHLEDEKREIINLERKEHDDEIEVQRARHELEEAEAAVKEDGVKINRKKSEVAKDQEDLGRLSRLK